jgi:hypothetical protein
MKNLYNREFEINKTTMRDLTPYEVDQVAGGSTITFTIPTFTITTGGTFPTTCTSVTSSSDVLK